MPVSKPAWLVTNGNSRLQEHWLITKRLRATPGQKRGIGAVLLAVLTVDWGANETATVVWPKPGRFWPVLETNDTDAGNTSASTALGFDWTISYTTTPEVPVKVTADVSAAHRVDDEVHN